MLAFSNFSDDESSGGPQGPHAGRASVVRSSALPMCSAEHRSARRGSAGASCAVEQDAGGHSGSLGSLRDHCRAFWKAGEIQHVMRLEKIQLRALQREITTRKSQRYCGVTAIPTRDHVECVLDGRGGHWKGIQTCGSKTCVHCHGPARLTKIEQADRGLYAVHQAGGSLVMLTLTCSNRGVGLSDQLDALQAVYRLVFKRRAISRWMEARGYIGAVRGTEVQIHCAERRFHPHLHLCLAFAQELTAEDAEELRAMVSARWCETMGKKGLFATFEQQHGELAHDEGAGSYVAKGAAEEIGSGALKKGKNGSVSWYGLLWSIMWADEDGDTAERDALVELYREFEQATYRRQWIAVSRRLVELAGEAPEEEQDPSEEAEEDAARVILVPLLIHRTLADMRIVHLVPALLSADEARAERFAKLCAEERRAAELRSYCVDGSGLLRWSLQRLFAGLVDRGVWAQNEYLGLYERGDDDGRRRECK